MKAFATNLPPVGGETIAIFGTSERPGCVLYQCLTHRKYLPIFVTCVEEALSLQAGALVSAFVLMDSLPVETALDFCRRLRVVNAITPVVAILNDATRSYGVDLLEQGADHFELQPLQIDSLLGALRIISWRPLRQTRPVL